jgi:hypothetical protein
VTPNRFKVLVLSYKTTPHVMFWGEGGEILPNFGPEKYDCDLYKEKNGPDSPDFEIKISDHQIFMTSSSR